MRTLIRHITILLVTVLAVTGSCHAQFFKAANTTNPTLYLPTPYPDESNPYWAQDIYRHFESKKDRDSIYVDAIKLVTYDYRSTSESFLRSYFINHLRFFQSEFGLTLNESNNVALFKFLDSCRMSSNQMLTLIPQSWYRTRPCVRLREATFGTFRTAMNYYYNYSSSPNNSFPSNETTYGWLTSMLMSCLNPWNADTILAKGIQHGWLRHVSGVMWYSDVNTSRQLGTVAFAQLMSIPKFRDRLRTMQSTTSALLGYTDAAATINELLVNDTLIAKMAAIIPPIGDERHGEYMSDMAWYQALKPLRDSLAAGELLASGLMDVENALDVVHPVLGISINPEQTPCLYYLYRSLEFCCEQLCELVRERSPQRRRPYDLFGHPPYTLENLSELDGYSSYPSLQASTGLATSLLMSMVVPSRRDTLLQIGYQYGLYRAIAGTSWYSDIDAGRVTGCLALAIIASGSDFIDLLEEARLEYIERHDHIITEVSDVRNDSVNASSKLFTIDGRPATPQSRGILVGRGRKIFVP